MLDTYLPKVVCSTPLEGGRLPISQSRGIAVHANPAKAACHIARKRQGLTQISCWERDRQARHKGTEEAVICSNLDYFEKGESFTQDADNHQA